MLVGSSTTPSRTDARTTTYRLFTTLLDPAEVTALDLAAAYTQRWEIELTFDELKTQQRGPRTGCARSRPTWSSRDLGTPVLPLRDPLLMNRSRHRLRARPGPGQLRRALRITRQTLATGRFSPLTNHGRDSPGWLYFLQRLIGRLNPARRQRAAPRVIKARCQSGTSNGLTRRRPQPQHLRTTASQG